MRDECAICRSARSSSIARINKATVTDYYVIDKRMEPEEVLRAVEHKVEEAAVSS